MENTDTSKTAGYILIIIGVLIALFLIDEMYILYLNPENGQFLNYMISKLSNNELIKFEGKAINLSEGAAFICSLLLLVLFASIIVTIAFNCVKYGVYAVSPRFAHELKSLELQLEKSQKNLMNGMRVNKHIHCRHSNIYPSTHRAFTFLTAPFFLYRISRYKQILDIKSKQANTYAYI